MWRCAGPPPSRSRSADRRDGGLAVTPSPERFAIAVPDAVLDDLDRRLAATRWPDDPGNEDWRYGTNRGLEDLVRYWRDGYDWRTQEAAMNRYDHYRVVLDGVPLHYLHRPGTGPDPLPLVLTHGWPWTFWDFAETIDAAGRPGLVRGRPRRRVRRGGPVASGVRVSCRSREPGSRCVPRRPSGCG